jgi:hypothetical protein
MSVSTNPGATTLEVIPRLPSSSHSDQTGFACRVIYLPSRPDAPDNTPQENEATSFQFQKTSGGAPGDAKGAGEICVNNVNEILVAHAHH